MTPNLPLACFVHLGDSIPRHLEANLVRTRRLFPDLDVLLISDAPLSKLRFTEEIGVDVTKPLEGHQGVLEAPILDADPRFWDGYWQKTFNRLFALQAAYTEDPGRTLVHIESDVLLLPSFPFEKFAGSQEIHWGEVGRSHDVAALLIIPGKEALLTLLSELSLQVRRDPELNDMTALHKIAVAKSVNQKYLPMVPEDHGSTGIGLYDGAPWGHYLYGTDPRAFYGRRIVGRRVNLSRFNPREYDLRVSENQLLVNGLPLHTLHIHSKVGFAFTDTARELEKRIKFAQSKSQLRRTRFSYSAFAFSLRTMLPVWAKSMASLRKWKSLLSRFRN